MSSISKNMKKDKQNVQAQAGEGRNMRNHKITPKRANSNPLFQVCQVLKIDELRS